MIWRVIQEGVDDVHVATTVRSLRILRCARSRVCCGRAGEIGPGNFINPSLNKESVLTDRKLDDSDRITPWLESLH